MKGAKAFLWQEIVYACGNVYSPKDRTPLGIQGVLCYPYSNIYADEGKSIVDFSTRYSLVGYINLIVFHAPIAVTAIKKSARDIMLPVTGILDYGFAMNYCASGIVNIGEKFFYHVKSKIQRNMLQQYSVFGDESGYVYRRFAVFGSIVAHFHSSYNVSSWLATGKNLFMSACGRVSCKELIPVKITGSLNSTSATALLALRGAISTVAYIASVPKKFQDFVTNKRWFR